MARTVPAWCPDPPARDTGHGGRWVERVYEIHLVTPLFGGGPTPGENDPVTLIRVPSIRGQLRFWWRATRGARFETVDELREEEGKIWGTTETPSKVLVRVCMRGAPEQKRWADYRRRPDGSIPSTPTPIDPRYPLYALFPFKGKVEKRGEESQVTQEPAVATIKASFEVHVKWPAHWDHEKDLEAAFWAWVNFGGLGARTKRGCGSLYCRGVSPSAADAGDIGKWYQPSLRRFGIDPDGPVRPWPTLGPRLLASHGKGDLGEHPLAAWQTAVGVLQRFRQGTGIGRAERKGGRGRSYWPEADSLRRITGKAHPRHAGTVTTSKNAFPRAELGLPIEFRFKDGSPEGPEPPDCQVVPLEGDRMASSVILKALAFSPDKALAIILPLKAERPQGVRVKAKMGEDETKDIGTFDSTAIRGSDLADYKHPPLKRWSRHGSALEAFLVYAEQKEGFR